MAPSLITVCSIYLPPSACVNQSDLSALVNELPPHFIIIDVFNCHSPLWGSGNVNPRGRQIKELINTHSLCLRNNREHAYLHHRSRSFHSLHLAISIISE
ncbi:hypothetical protein AVEN_251976-1 [Araneus ventricosus]|uniref:Endonuclease/exonuclease/phosphatase domain-containing protein n=1 Tax=Araneus ventricosus TaxID=182803 RepID=A0A4Y2HN46_ARAVE|nr:hypothetical protein AVEN_251976-1 [Araneus ventricosus]